MSLVRVRIIFLSITAAVVVLLVIVAAASTISMQAAQLTTSPTVWEITTYSEDGLIISHSGAGEIWAGSGAGSFTVYENITGAQDAKSDQLGTIWWSDKGSTFGQIFTPTQVVTRWQLPDDQKVWGLALDDQDRIWLSGWSTADSRLFNFDIVSSQLCTYTIPPSTNSSYVAHNNGDIWLADRAEDRIIRLTETTTETLVAWWMLPDDRDFGPHGLIPDDSGNLWWADQGTAGIGYLDTSINEMKFYTLPIGAEPQMVSLESDWVWYTEHEGGSDGTLGAFRPDSAAHYTATLAAELITITPYCDSLLPISSRTAVTRSVNLTWTAPVTLKPAFAQDGWWIYQTTAQPYGLAVQGDRLFLTDQAGQKLMKLPLPILGQLNLMVTPSPDQAIHGGDLDYTYTATYTSRDNSPAAGILLEDDGCSPIIGPTGDSNNDGLLDVDEIWQYACTVAIGSHDDDEDNPLSQVSTAKISGQDADGAGLQSGEVNSSVLIDHDLGTLEIDKTGPAAAAHGVVAAYLYSLTYSSLDGASAVNAALDDDKCPDITLTGGDSDGDDRLDNGETWTYSCQTTVPDHVGEEENPLINEVTVEAGNFDGDRLQPAKDQHATTMTHTSGSLILAKIGPELAEHGDEITYNFILAYENQDRSPATSITLEDDQCSPVKYVSGDNNHDDQLDVGEFWLYRCYFLVPPHHGGEQTPILNRATAAGENLDGKTLSAAAVQHILQIIESKLFLPLANG